MIKVKEYNFQQTTTLDQSNVRILIQEILSADYGYYVWPSAIVLAEWVWNQQNEIKGKCVLELGAGTGLPGLLCSCIGASKVFLTDIIENKSILNNLEQTILLNKDNLKSEVVVVGHRWGDFALDMLAILPIPSIILAADCFYDNSSQFDDVLASVSYLLRKDPNQNGVFVTTYQVRSSYRTISHLFAKWDMEAETIPIESFMDDEKLGLLANQIELVIIKLKK